MFDGLFAKLYNVNYEKANNPGTECYIDYCYRGTDPPHTYW